MEIVTANEMNNARSGVLVKQQTLDVLPMGDAAQAQLPQWLQILPANAIKSRGAQSHPILPRPEGADHA